MTHEEYIRNAAADEEQVQSGLGIDSVMRNQGTSVAANPPVEESEAEQWMRGGMETYSMFLQSYD